MADQRVRSIADVRAWIGPAADGRSDEDVLGAFAKATGYSPATVAGALGYDTATGAGPWRERGSSSIDSYQANLYGVGEAVAGSLGLNGVRDAMASRRRANEFASQVSSERSQLGGLKSSYKDVDWTSPSDIGGYVGGLALDSAPYVAEAALGGVAGRMVVGGAGTAARMAAGTAGATIAGYPSAVGDVLSNQRDQNGTTDLGAAAALGVPYAALNAGLGVEGRIARGSVGRSTISALDNMGGFRGGAARAGATALATGVTEGVSETGQEMLNQAGRIAVDPTASMFSDEAVDRYKESFVGGAVLGGAFGGAGGGWRRSEGYKPPVDAPAGANLLGQDRPEFELQSYGPADGPMPGGYQPAPEQNYPASGGLGPGWEFGQQRDMFNPNGTPTYGADNWGGDSLNKPVDVMPAARTGLTGQGVVLGEEPAGIVPQPLALPQNVQGDMYRRVADKADAGLPLTPTEENILNTYSSQPRAVGPAPQFELPPERGPSRFAPNNDGRPLLTLNGDPTPQYEAPRPIERPAFDLEMQGIQGELDLQLRPDAPVAPQLDQSRHSQRGVTNELPFVPPEAKINTPAGRQLYGLAESLNGEGFMDEATLDQVTTLLTQSKLAKASKIINQTIADKKAAKAALQKDLDVRTAEEAKAAELAAKAAESQQEPVSKQANTSVTKADKITPVPQEKVASKVDKYERLIACLKG